MKKAFLFICAVGVLSIVMGSVLSAADRPLDDRELFMGITSSAQVKPNIMILADNSLSMNTAIYHPAYNGNHNYMVDADNNDLTLNGITNFFSTQATYYRTDTLTSFRICRGMGGMEDKHARGIYASRSGRVWTVNKNPSYPDPFRTGDTLRFTRCTRWQGATCSRTGAVNTTMTSVIDNGSTWTITVSTDYYPDTSTKTVDSYYQLPVYDDDYATAMDQSESCGEGPTALDITLYGDDDNGQHTIYDHNYMYWLAFYATSEQIAQVNHWATTGEYTDSETGELEFAGYTRIKVERQVLVDVATEVWDSVNMGLSVFYNTDEGARVFEPMSNTMNGGTLNSMTTQLNNLDSNAFTPLGESMIDIWYYYKGGTGEVYWPNGMNGASTNCGTPTQTGPPTSCPIQFYCQKNYVVVMTDGQSTYDQMNDSKYVGSYFDNTDISEWGDGDDHDPSDTGQSQPASLTKSDGTPYCAQSTCWMANMGGTDYLDDMAYFLRNNDLFPDDLYPDMPGQQNIETFAIGFTLDNDLLKETAQNGNGVYYSAKNYASLKNALMNAIINILLRNFAFASFTAPKKVTTTVGEGYSYVGYFMPSASNAIWEGHLQAFKLTDKWCVDADESGELEEGECDTFYVSKVQCASENAGKTCLQTIELSSAFSWDASSELPDPRSLYTSNGSTLVNFSSPSSSELTTLTSLIGASDETQTQTIIDKIKGQTFGDVFHSDIAFVGAPVSGKQYLRNYNPGECDLTAKTTDADCYEKFMNDNVNRTKVLYVGTNDGIVHQINAGVAPVVSDGGVERWGYIPDEILPSLKSIVIDQKYTFTADGRMLADDIFYRSVSGNSWKTILTYGLKDGGNAYYALDVTAVSSTPSLLWKFKDATYSGRSWGKPQIGKIKHDDGSTVLDRWVVIVPGGMAFNDENPADLQGKAVFVLDASTGQVLWMAAYNENGEANDANTPEVDLLLDSTYTTGLRYLTSDSSMNFAIPSSLTVIDRDGNNYLDTVYFGNVAGQMFKIDLSAADPNDWKLYHLLKRDLQTFSVTDTVDEVSGTVVTVGSASGFEANQNVIGRTSHAMAVIEATQNKDLTMTYMPGSPSFQVAETIDVPAADPFFLAPAIAFDPCYNLWVMAGTGDRIRSRTNPSSGKFFGFRDGTTLVSGVTLQKTQIQLSDLVDISSAWSTGTDALAETDINISNKWGWYFSFPNSSNYEKLFDPDPVILPDEYQVPHIIFNTYQPPTEAPSSEACNAPSEGDMYYYDIAVNFCGSGTISGFREPGRIAGGGIYQGAEFIIYEGTGTVASLPPLQQIRSIQLPYAGGLIFWKEKRR